jgi:hypothetical protein
MMPSTYEHAVRLRAEYDIIFTHVRELAARYPETFRFCPFATTYLRHWQHRMYPKSKLLSIIASTKGYHVEGGGMQGHRLRHEAIRRLGPTITGVYAKGYQHAEKGWHTNKIASLRYAFCLLYWYKSTNTDAAACSGTTCSPSSSKTKSTTVGSQKS